MLTGCFLSCDLLRCHGMPGFCCFKKKRKEREREIPGKADRQIEGDEKEKSKKRTKWIHTLSHTDISLWMIRIDSR